ncbi:hypothetical protein BDQ12DRAFT_731481 [Crucibulum laeve]|uniref:Uncharacterized protein n=1 Tax=Crucibulum laeve TaxID=68775 RepID=A0A5C3MDC5_9AGAR|nr:hypothetical protein BDQ12DRAFT_731481 [Crucibulum laeve]
MTESELADVKIPLPSFLKLLTSNNISVPKSMAISAAIYKEYNTPAKLGQLGDVKLKAAGIDDKDDRKIVLAAIRKAGYAYKRKPLSKKTDSSETTPQPTVAGPSTASPMTAVEAMSTPAKKKRKRHEDTNEFLPDGPPDEASKYGSLEFNEIVDEEILKNKSAVVNRAPLMTAWATIVAERMNFQREEALSIASVYTEMNAVSKGVSLGCFEKGREMGMEATRTGSQPYVELMGRRPLYRTQTGQWRALSNGDPVPPSTAFSYISRSFRQTTPHIIGALRLLAGTYSRNELNKNGWGLYTEFRPTADEWGARSEVRCSSILALREKNAVALGYDPSVAESTAVKVENVDEVANGVETDEPERKKARGMTLEEYEAALDEDTTFNDVDLDFATETPEVNIGNQ